MRVLHVLSSLNIGSGIANFVMNYYRNLPEDCRFDFLVMENMPNQFNAEIESGGKGGRIFLIEKPTLNFSSYAKKVKKFFSEHRGEWDIVHVHEILLQRFILRNAKKYGGVKRTVMHSHMISLTVPAETLKGKFKNAVKSVRNALLLQGFKRRTDWFFACSVAAGEMLFGKKIVNGDRFFVAKNAVDTSKYLPDGEIRREYRESFGFTDEKVLIHVGRFSVEKNQLFLLDVFSEIAARDPSYRLMLVGDGRLREQAAEKAEKLGLSDKIIATGNRSDVGNLLRCADIFVLPSVIEGLGTVLIEAQASGLPCVCSSSVPKEAAITPHVVAIGLSSGAAAWAEEILRVDTARYDPSVYIAESGYDLKSATDALVAKYAEICG